MSILSADERADFIEAASAFIASKERMKLMQETAKKTVAIDGASIRVEPEKVESVMQPGKRLMNVLISIIQNHPNLPPIRFRGHLFWFNRDRGRIIGMTMVREAEIENIVS